MESNRLLLGTLLACFAPLARAQLSGTEIVVTQFFQGPQPTQTFGAHVYGGGPAGATQFHDLQAPQEVWVGTSPAPGAPPEFDNAMLCDYAGFHSDLLVYAGTSTAMIIDTILVPVAEGSVRVFNSAGLEIGGGGGAGTTIMIKVEIDDIRSGPAPAMVVAWDNEGAACYPDCNSDGALNLADFGCFQTKFALGDPYADCNGDGVRNLSDFGCFQTKFALGCP